MTEIACPCSYVEIVDDGHNRKFDGECSICVVNGGDFKKSPHWKEPERAPITPPSWRVQEVDLETGSYDGTVIPFPSTAKARTAASARGRDKKAKKKKAAAASAAATGK